MHKAVHTQGSAHTWWFVATAGVLSFKGSAGASSCVERGEPPVERSEPKRRLAVYTQGTAYTRRCTHKVVHT